MHFVLVLQYETHVVPFALRERIRSGTENRCGNPPGIAVQAHQEPPEQGKASAVWRMTRDFFKAERPEGGSEGRGSASEAQ